MSYEELVLASLHEAGHAAAVAILGGLLENVTLDQMTRHWECDLGGWQLAVASMAGSVAARRLGPKWRSLSRLASGQDTAVAESALEQAPGEDLRTARMAAEQFVRDHRSHIDRVARALREQEILDHEAVENILLAVPGPVTVSYSILENKAGFTATPERLSVFLRAERDLPPAVATAGEAVAALGAVVTRALGRSVYMVHVVPAPDADYAKRGCRYV